jgi:ADP-ribose pyrophosphatase
MIDLKIVASRADSASKRIYNSVEHDVQLPNGKVVTWSCVEGPDIAVVLAIDADENIYMKKEWRLSRRGEVLEIVSGRINKNETPVECAMRELKEEIGVTAKELIPMGAISLWNHATVHAHLFLAKDLEVGENNPDEGEILKLEKVPFAQALQRAKEVGTNAQTLLSLYIARDILAPKKQT